MIFEKIYHSYLLHLNELNVRERYEGRESWYHASGAGFCSRKLYFESVEKAKPTNPANKQSTRVMGLGSLIHNDIESSLLYYNNINKDNINKDNINKDYIAKYSMHNFHLEGEIELPEFNVRGYYDVVMEDRTDSKDDPYIRLYDIKTVSGYAYKQKFGKYKVTEPSRNHYMQLATYGLAVKEKFGHLDSMDLIYYNKDDSRMKSQSVPLDYLSKAYKYWYNINEEHAKGLPMFNLGTSPTQKWMCGYCSFKDHCNPPKFK